MSFVSAKLRRPPMCIHRMGKYNGGTWMHQFLEVQSKYADWLKNRIEKYYFVENQDYLGFTENLVKPQGGRPTIEYGLSLDMAKELCMVENKLKAIRNMEPAWCEVAGGNFPLSEYKDSTGRRLQPFHLSKIAEMFNISKLPNNGSTWMNPICFTCFRDCF